jgi:hypothetical protein
MICLYKAITLIINIMKKSAITSLEEIEIKYQDNMYLLNIEKKFNRIQRLKVDPYVESVVVQYYLRELFGDHNDNGLLLIIKDFLKKLKIDYEVINELHMTQNMKSIKKIISLRKKKAEKLYSLINDDYLKYISIARKEKYCLLCNIEYLHNLQIKTFNILKNKKFNDVEQHIYNIKQEKSRLNNLLDNNNNYEEIIEKLITSQINVLEQQLEMLTNN